MRNGRKERRIGAGENQTAAIHQENLWRWDSSWFVFLPFHALARSPFYIVLLLTIYKLDLPVQYI